MTEKNHEYYVSLEVAQLLKKAGFDWECSHWYSLDSSQWLTDRETNNLSPENKKRFVHRPSLAVAQKWLREVKNIDVVVSRAMQWKQFYYTISHEENRTSKIDFMSLNKDLWWFKYEEALEAGIYKALEIILKKGE